MSEIHDYWLNLAKLLNPKLDLGCGSNKQKGFIGVDFSSRPDVISDFESSLPFSSSSIEFIWCDQTLEHVQNLIPLMNECHRILSPGSHMWIGVPRFPEPESVIDPTHVRFFVPGTFDYFCSPSAKFDYGIKTWKRILVMPLGWGVVAVLQKPEG